MSEAGCPHLARCPPGPVRLPRLRQGAPFPPLQQELSSRFSVVRSSVAIPGLLPGVGPGTLMLRTCPAEQPQPPELTCRGGRSSANRGALHQTRPGKAKMSPSAESLTGPKDEAEVGFQGQGLEGTQNPANRPENSKPGENRHKGGRTCGVLA